MKVINTAATAQMVELDITGATGIAPKGEAIIMSAEKPDDTNSINDPTKVVPVTTPVDGLGTSFAREFPAYSITVLKLTKK